MKNHPFKTTLAALLASAFLPLCSLCQPTNQVNGQGSTNTPPYNPKALFEKKLKEINCDAPTDLNASGNMLFCTVHCRNQAENDLVYNAFRDMPKYGLTAAKSPHKVCVVLVIDPQYLNRENQQAVLDEHAVNLSGKVLQKTTGGLLISMGDHVVMLADKNTGKLDDDKISFTGWMIGDYEYNTTQGAPKTVRKYTRDPEVALLYYGDLVDEATRKRVGAENWPQHQQPVR